MTCAMCDAVAYVVRNGIKWRALPTGFPPWEAVYAFYERWNGSGRPLELIRRLRELLRQHQGRTARPTACIVDSQIVKAADTVGKKTTIAAITVEVVKRTSPLSFQVVRRRWVVERTSGWL